MREPRAAVNVGKVTRLHGEDERVIGHKTFIQFQSQQKGLAPPHDQLIRRDFNGAMGGVVRPKVEIHSFDLCNRKAQSYSQ